MEKTRTAAEKLRFMVKIARALIKESRVDVEKRRISAAEKLRFKVKKGRAFVEKLRIKLEKAIASIEKSDPRRKRESRRGKSEPRWKRR